jgi:hypothetical protein
MRKMTLCVLAVVAASTAVMACGRSQASIIAPRALSAAADELRLAETVQFSCEAGVTAGTTPDGAAADGTGVAIIGGAVWAGAVRPAGTGGDGQVSAR